MRRPFFWKARSGWYVKTSDKRNCFLSKDEAEAKVRWAAMPGNESRPITVLDLAELHRELLELITQSERVAGRLKTR